jgi:hypothetical protein
MSTHRVTTHGLVATTARRNLRVHYPSARAVLAWLDEPRRARTSTSSNGRMYSLLLRSAERPDSHGRV